MEQKGTATTPETAPEGATETPVPESEANVPLVEAAPPDIPDLPEDATPDQMREWAENVRKFRASATQDKMTVSEERRQLQKTLAEAQAEVREVLTNPTKYKEIRQRLGLDQGGREDTSNTQDPDPEPTFADPDVSTLYKRIDKRMGQIEESHKSTAQLIESLQRTAVARGRDEETQRVFAQTEFSAFTKEQQALIRRQADQSGRPVADIAQFAAAFGTPSRTQSRSPAAPPMPFVSPGSGLPPPPLEREEPHALSSREQKEMILAELRKKAKH